MNHRRFRVLLSVLHATAAAALAQPSNVTATNALLPGNVYIFQPNLALTGGGPQSFHLVHHELLAQGFSSRHLQARLLEQRCLDDEPSASLAAQLSTGWVTCT